MDEKQERKFKEWLDTTGRVYRDDCRDAWEACIEANKVEEQEPEQTPTEMMRVLLEKGWKVHVSGIGSCWLESPRDAAIKSLDRAYREAFPPKKKVEVEVWGHQHKGEWVACTHSLRTGWVGDDKGNMSTPESLLEAGWVKGIATFWVEDE